MYDIAVIGGGASGLFSAIHAAELLKQGKVVVLERNQRTGKKLLVTGNGRCNLTNNNLTIDRFHSDNMQFVSKVLENQGFEATKSFFYDTGIIYYSENDKVFPSSLQASSVVDMLRFRLLEAGVDEICDFNCVSLTKKDVFSITAKDGRVIKTKKIIFACGGAAAPKSGSDGSCYNLLKTFGHRMTQIFPSLVQLICDSKKVVPLKGVKFNGNISVYVNDKHMKTEFGEILFTEYGLSGPPVFQISRIASQACLKKDKCKVVIDLMPSYSQTDIYSLLSSRNKNLTLDIFTNGLFNKAIGRELIKSSTSYKLNLKASVLNENDFQNLSYTIKNWCFEVIGTKGWDAAQVTAGGIKLDGFNPDTMESEYCDGLYACGEVLDVDGDCGGFNLQWAWSSGAVAGISAAQKINEGK